MQPGNGGTGFYFQHLGGRDREISVSSRPALSTELVPGQLGLWHNETLGHKTEVGGGERKRVAIDRTYI